METKFKTLRLEYQEDLKDKNHKQNFTQEDLSKEFEKIGYYISRQKIGKLEIGSSEVQITKEILLAYHDFFGVTTDWLLGISETR